MLNMKKSNNFLVAALLGVAALLCALSCSRTSVSGNVAGGADAEIIALRQVSGNYECIDTVLCDSDGNFRFDVEIAKGDPDFVYLRKDGRNIASLILFRGDKVEAGIAEDGTLTIKGSDESALLADVEKDFKAFIADMSAEPTAVKYIDYYRSRVAYILTHKSSLTCIPVLYQSVNASLPVFGQKSDALFFKDVSDTLYSLYPDSRYVKSLKADAALRMKALEINARLSVASSISYPEIELPDVSGEMHKLSETPGKVKLLYFWMAASPIHNNYNMEVLKPLYAKYHSKGLEIYAVSLDPDKTLWATGVKAQKLPWVNVNDVVSVDSRYAALYNVKELPALFLLTDETIIPLSAQSPLDAKVKSLL